MRRAHRVSAERGDEIETSRIGPRKGQKGEIASVGKHRNRRSVYRQGSPPIPHMTENEARVPRVDESIGRWVLHMNTQRPFDERNGGQRRPAGRLGRGRPGGCRCACAQRDEKRDTAGASRDWVTQHEVKLTALAEVGEAVTVCRASPAFLYCRGTRSGCGEPPGGIVTTQPPETSILYAHPRSTCSPTS